MEVVQGPAALTAGVSVVASHILHILRQLHAVGLSRGKGTLRRYGAWPASLQEAMRDSFLSAAQERYTVLGEFLAAAVRAIGSAPLSTASEEQADEPKVRVPCVRTLFEDNVTENGIPNELAFTDFRDMMVSITERALDHRTSARSAKVNWTRTDGQDAYRHLLRRVVFRLSKRKARGSLKFSIRASKVSAAIRDAGLSASTERVREWITSFSGEKIKPQEEPDNRMMGPFSYSDWPRTHHAPGRTAGANGQSSQSVAAGKINRQKPGSPHSQPKRERHTYPQKQQSVQRKAVQGKRKPRPPYRLAMMETPADASEPQRSVAFPDDMMESSPRRPVVHKSRVPYLAAEMLMLSMLSASAMNTLVQKRSQEKGRPLIVTDEDEPSSSEESSSDSQELVTLLHKPRAAVEMDAKVLRRRWLGLGDDLVDEPRLLRDVSPPRWDDAAAWVGDRREWLSHLEV
eukprot:scaffold149590_cov37-Tisochrysis_lutea.AAC.1